MAASGGGGGGASGVGKVNGTGAGAGTGTVTTAGIASSNSTTTIHDTTPATHKPPLDTPPPLRLADYWFLHNTREAGCAFSEGRADWGNATLARATAPPEVRGGFKISPASDVYAFGVCCLAWARCANRMTDIDLAPQNDQRRAKVYKVKMANRNTELGRAVLRISGLGDNNKNALMHTTPVVLPPIEPLKNIHTLLPPRWGKDSWLQTLLRMCLQENPKYRSTSGDVLAFLQSVDLGRYEEGDEGDEGEV